MAAPKEAGALQMTADQILAKNINITLAHCQIHRVLSQNGIPYVILKGSASAFYYPEPTARAMGDVDFLVAKENVRKAGEALLQNGFAPIQNDNEHHYEFRKDGILYELHYAVNGVPEGQMGGVVESYLADTIETAQTRNLKYGHAMLPDEFHHGLIILLHNARHMVSSGMGLRHLCDWAVFVHRVSDFPERFEQPLRQMGLWIYACQMTALCCRYLGLPGQSWCGSWDDELMEAMIEDIIGAGNFGRKRQDNRDRWLTTNITAGGVSNRSMLAQLLHSVNEVTKMRWPAAKKCFLLLPLGWICFGGGYLLRMVAGKEKKLHVKQMVRDAKKRRGLYSQFKLFETQMNPEG